MTRKYKKPDWAPLALLSLTGLVCAPALADFPGITGLPDATLASEIKYKDAWSFHLSPYLWLAGLSGHANVHGTRTTFSTSPSQVLHQLDMSVGLNFEANKGLWTLLLDPDYVKVTQKPAIRNTNRKATYETTITDAGAYYRIFSQPAVHANYSQTSFELLAAGRVVTFHTVIDLLNNRPTASASDTSSVVVPVLGARLKYNFSPKLHTWLSGDFGGFQVSHVSSTWSGSLGISYNFSNFFDLSLAYKVFAVDYSINAVTYNTLLQGPAIGCGFSW